MIKETSPSDMKIGQRFWYTQLSCQSGLEGLTWTPLRATLTIQGIYPAERIFIKA